MRIPKLHGAMVVATDVFRVYRDLLATKDPRARSLQPFDRNFRAGLRYFRPLMLYQVNTLIDIGANRGNFLFPAITYFRPKFVLAIEPIPHLAQALQQRLMHYSKVTQGVVFQGVVSNSIGEMKFHVTDYSSSSSLLYPASSASQGYGKSFDVVETLTVNSTTLDTLAQRYNLSSVDLIKIDVQGGERLVIEGGLGNN